MNRSVLLGVVAFVALSFLFTLLILQRLQLVKEEQEKEGYEIVNQAKDKLQEALSHSLSATKTISFFIDKNGVVNNFDSVAAQILESGTDIDALELVPDGVIQFVYPLKGNEDVLGYNILQDATRNKEAYKAIEKKEMFFAGPFPLKQGDIGVVGRLPVYRQNKFWGFSAVVIKMSTLFRTAGIDSMAKHGYTFQLSKINPDTKKEEYFLPLVTDVKHTHAVSVDVPNGEWILSLSLGNPYKGAGDIILLAFLGLLLSILAGLFIYRVADRPKKLEALVLNRTKELNTSENNYRSLIERVSDAFISLDKNWTFTYVNKKAGELLERDHHSLIGKNIWQEFPKTIDYPFYHVFHKAIETQQYQYLEAYYEHLDRWYENHIYPSNDGLTVFFNDVTEIKQVSKALKENEEKYRSLIEQASDGIVITDLGGNIIEVNKSIQKMIGFTDKEMLGHHLTEYMPEEDLKSIPLRINKLMQGNGLLYERKLVKKDGTVMNVEVNSKMASSQTLIGFVRDITDRKITAQALKESKEHFELIAEVTNDAVWDHNFERNETWGNNKLYSLYGMTIGKDKINLEMFLDHIHPADRNGVQERLKQALAEHAISVSEVFRFRTGEGLYKIFLDRAYIKYDEAGNPIRILGAMQDISENGKAQKAILKSEEKFRNIIEQASDGIFIADESMYFIDVNSAGCKMTGYTLTELQKIKFIDLMPKQDIEKLPVQITSMKPGESITNERRLIRKDGTLIDVEISAKKLLDGRYQSFARDITERKKATEKIQQSEQKYKLLFYNNPLPMWMTSIPGLDIIDVNEAAIIQYGYSREEFLKLNAKDMRPQEDVAHFISEVQKMKPGINNTRTWRHKRKDGSLIHVEIYNYEIFYEGQRVWLGLSHDVTDKYRAKELLEKSYKDIRELASNLQSIREDERANIAREIHDELGQQLTGLKMDLHWLGRKINSSDNDVNNKLKESIELINATITSVRKIATDLRPSILDDLGLLAALEWQGEEFEKRSGIKVEYINNAGEIDLTPGVTTAIFRIYQELLTNIARHANASQVTALLKKDEQWLYFSINDNGVGFDLATINTKKTLGLLGIKERTLLLGGTYKIKSKPGEGTVTTISIPLTAVLTTT